MLQVRISVFVLFDFIVFCPFSFFLLSFILKININNQYGNIGSNFFDNKHLIILSLIILLMVMMISWKWKWNLCFVVNYNKIDEPHKKTEQRIVSHIFFFPTVFSRRCKDNPECRYFTIDTRKLMCYLKSEKHSTERTDMTVALVSGNMLWFLHG
jgi:hypothetical protein